MGGRSVKCSEREHPPFYRTADKTLDLMMHDDNDSSSAPIAPAYAPSRSPTLEEPPGANRIDEDHYNNPDLDADALQEDKDSLFQPMPLLEYVACSSNSFSSAHHLFLTAPLPPPPPPSRI